MIEVLAIFGLIGWLILIFWEWLSSLEVFPFVVGSAALFPFLVFRDYICLLRRFHLQGVRQKRNPIPPERFYWRFEQRRILRSIGSAGAIAVVGWCNAATLPAGLHWDAVSALGALNALAGLLGLTRFTSAFWVFVRASQWFDAMRPSIIGLCRLLMYKLSANYEYLGRRQPETEREKVY